MIKCLILIAVVMGLVPVLIGMSFTKYMKEERNSLFFAVLIGYMIMLGVFELFVLPCIYFKRSLMELSSIYMAVLAVWSVCSVIMNRKHFVEVIRNVIIEIGQNNGILVMSAGVVLFQLFYYFKHVYYNADDAVYVASAVTSYTTNTIFEINPYTGELYEKLPTRYVLSPLHAFYAILSEYVGTHPAIFIHTVCMFLFLMLGYMVYYLFAGLLFDNDVRKKGYFMVMVMVLLLFSGFSERTAGTFFIIRLWQGKAILAGILLPFVLYLVIRIYLNRHTVADWIVLFFTMCSCCMVSSMGIMLGAVAMGLAGSVTILASKRWSDLVRFLLCGSCNIVLSVIYLMIH